MSLLEKQAQRETHLLVMLLCQNTIVDCISIFQRQRPCSFDRIFCQR